jgi:hypothetical protein
MEAAFQRCFQLFVYEQGSAGSALDKIGGINLDENLLCFGMALT